MFHCLTSIIIASISVNFQPQPEPAAHRPGDKRIVATQPAAEQRAVTDPAALGRADLATARGGPAQGKRDETLQPHALFHGPLPTVFAFSKEGRLFVAFPRWGIPANSTVAEVKDGKLVPFPDAESNEFYPDEPGRVDVGTHLVSVQSIVVDDEDRLWIIDTGSVNMGPVIDGAPKMWAYDLATGRRVKQIPLSGDAIKKNTYLNDARFDLKRGGAGYAYITDSGAGGIIVVDLASGDAWRKLDGHPSVMAKDIEMLVEGQPMKQKDGQTPKIHSDGIALSPDGKTLYYTPLTGRELYAVPTDVLADREISDEETGKAVRKIADMPSANDGIVCDAAGRIYTTDFEDNAIRRYTPGSDTATEELIVQDERLLWPDCVIVHDGALYVTSNQLHRQPQFQGGQSKLQEPFVLFRYPLEAEARER